MTTTRTMPFMQKIASIAFAFALVLSLMPTFAFAATGMGGNVNTVSWEIDENGKLILQPMNGSSGVMSSFAEGNKAPWCESDYPSKITSVEVRSGVVAGASIQDMFAGLERVREIDLTGLQTSGVTDMRGVFYQCKALTKITFGNFNTSNVTDMGSMFAMAESLTEVNLSGFDTSKVTNMAGMFMDCSSLTSVGVSSLSTPKLQNTRAMFSGCRKLVSLDLSNFDTSRVSDMGGMFENCTALKSLNLSGFETGKVENMDNIFNNCRALTSLKLGDDFEFVGAGAKLPEGDWYTPDGVKHTAAEIASNPDLKGPFTKSQPNQTPPTVTVADKEPWQSGDSSGMEIKTDIAPEEIVCVKVDGKVIDRSNYTIDEKTGAVVLKPEFLETLPSGNHQIGIVSAAGTATAPIKVSGTAAKPSGSSSSSSSKPSSGSSNSGGSQSGSSIKPYDGVSHVMYRLYNPNSGEHFFTTNPTERDRLDNLGWDYEGVAWTAPDTGVPVYRLYNKYAGEHHYTKSKAERNMLVAAGWNDEGVGWYADPDQRVPLYRLYNPNEYANNHHYTTSEQERDHLASIGWRYEGIGWHGVAA